MEFKEEKVVVVFHIFTNIMRTAQDHFHHHHHLLQYNTRVFFKPLSQKYIAQAIRKKNVKEIFQNFSHIRPRGSSHIFFLHYSYSLFISFLMLNCRHRQRGISWNFTSSTNVCYWRNKNSKFSLKKKIIINKLKVAHKLRKIMKIKK